MSSISLYGVGGWIFAGLGVSLILLGVFARRVVVRTEPHCAKCGYPLDNLPQTEGVVICPECGREPKNPTETYTLRRPKLAIAIGSAMIAGALVLPMVPTIQRQGWTSALPMSVQIEMWASGDQRLRERVRYSFRTDELSKYQRSLLRAQLMKAFDRPATPTPIIEDAVEYLDFTFTKNQIIDEQDLVQIIRDTTSPVRWRYMQYTSHYPAPLTSELAEIRRSLAFDTTNEPAQRNAIEWLIRAPADAQDLETIGQLLSVEDPNVSWKMMVQFDHASKPAMEVMIESLAHPDTTVRARAMRCIHYYFSRVRTEPMSIDYAPILALINDPDPSLSRTVTLIVENLPLDAEPLIEELLGTITDPETLSFLIHAVLRRDPEPIGLLPALASITRDERHSLSTRIEAANAYEYIRRRARTGDEPEPIWAVYDQLIDALIKDDIAAAFAFASQSQSSYTPWAVAAIGRRALQEGVKRDQLTDWLTNRPGIEALLGMLSPAIGDPTERYLRTLIDIRDDRRYSPKIVQDSVNLALDAYFPDAPAPSAP